MMEAWNITGRYCSLEINSEQESVWYNTQIEPENEIGNQTDTVNHDSIN
ncbi:MAG: hypothetical protein OCC49_08175 [Fibrobacterales bacterium]